MTDPTVRAASLSPGAGRAPVRPAPGKPGLGQTRRAEIAVERGIDLACMVRDEGIDSITVTLRSYSRSDLEALSVALAAMVPVDQPAAQLLEWTNALLPGYRPPRPTEPRQIRLMECGTHAAFNRHKKRGEDIDDECLEAEREYQRVRSRLRRRSAAVS